MSTIKVTNIEHASTANGGIQLDNAGHVTVDGQQMPTAGALSNRNLIINGAHIVWQRQTSVSGGSVLDNFAYATDRFWLYAPNSTSGTVGQSTDAPSGFIYSTHNNLDASCNIGLNVELLKQGSDAPFVNGESLTLSFYIKSTSTRTGVALTITTRDNAGGAGSVTRATGVTFDSTTSWTRVEKTFALSGAVGSNNRCFQIEFSLAIGDKVTGFQLEKGDKATPFEHRSYGDELARCQRYFQTSFTDNPGTGNTSNVGVAFAGGGATGNTTSFIGGAYIQLSPTMRAAPTVTIFDLASPRNTGKLHRHTYGQAGSNNNTAVVTDTNTKSFVVRSDSGASASGIIFHWKAECEL